MERYQIGFDVGTLNFGKGQPFVLHVDESEELAEPAFIILDSWFGTFHHLTRENKTGDKPIIAGYNRVSRQSCDS